jgi:hypothetical protein
MYTEFVKTRTTRDRLRHLARASVGCLLGAMSVHLGPTTTSQAVDRINSMSTRPLPSVAPRPVVREPLVWVPDRVVPLPGEGNVVVPGHWERPLEPHQVHVPSLTVRNPETGATTTLPAGIRPPTDERIGP